MNLKNFTKEYIKYPVAIAGSALALAGAEKAVSSLDDYVAKHEPQAQVWQASADYLSEIRQGLDGVAYAGEPHIPEEVKDDPVFKIFDGGVYKWGSEDFPGNRYKAIANTYLCNQDKDLHFLIEDKKLYNAIGKDLEKNFKENSLMLVGFKKGSDEIGVSIKKGNDFYIGFMDVPSSIVNRIAMYDKE